MAMLNQEELEALSTLRLLVLHKSVRKRVHVETFNRSYGYADWQEYKDQIKSILNTRENISTL